MDMKKLFATFEASYDNDKEFGQSLGDYFAERLGECENIRHHLDKLNQEQQEAKKQYEETLRWLAQERSNVQKNCSHPATTYYPDASGNNDSHSECDICGIEVARRSNHSGAYDG